MRNCNFKIRNFRYHTTCFGNCLLTPSLHCLGHVHNPLLILHFTYAVPQPPLQQERLPPPELRRPTRGAQWLCQGPYTR
jgi:hypothetical protein